MTSSENGRSPGCSANESASSAVTSAASSGPRIGATVTPSGHCGGRGRRVELDRHLVLRAVAHEARARRAARAGAACRRRPRWPACGPRRTAPRAIASSATVSPWSTSSRSAVARSASSRSRSGCSGTNTSENGGFANTPPHATMRSPSGASGSRRTTTGKSRPASRPGSARMRRMPGLGPVRVAPGHRGERPLRDVEHRLHVVVGARPQHQLAHAREPGTAPSARAQVSVHPAGVRRRCVMSGAKRFR